MPSPMSIDVEAGGQAIDLQLVNLGDSNPSTFKLNCVCKLFDNVAAKAT